jgi:predicted HAD superfamily Cof-like phosphohydrolase
MTKEQQQVREFHRLFGATVNDRPTNPSWEDMDLRSTLMHEELAEFDEASAHPVNLAEVADALVDLLYVLLGTAVTYGIDLEPVFQEVHRSNMSKLWTTAESAAMPQGSTAKAVRSSGSPFDRCLVVKRADGKVIKSPSYEPADISAIIRAQEIKTA